MMFIWQKFGYNSGAKISDKYRYIEAFGGYVIKELH